MRKKENGWIVLMLTAAVSLLLILAVQLIESDKKVLSRHGTLEQIAILGEFRIDEGAWQPLLTESQFNLDDHHNFSFRGQFNREIIKNQHVMLRIPDLCVRIKLNGTDF